MGVVKRCVEAPSFVEELCPIELVVLLVVVVGLVAVITDVAQLVVILAGIIVAWVAVQNLGIDSVPCDSCFLVTKDEDGFEECFGIGPTTC